MMEGQIALGRSQAEAERRADDPDFYSDAFFVPAEARWPRLRDEQHHQVGDGLNKALGALEDHNPSLEGVLQHIDFNRRVGTTTVTDRKWRDLIGHFSKYRLRNEDFEFPDLLGAAYEYLIRDFRGLRGQEGRRVLHAPPGGAADGAPRRPATGHGRVRPVLGLGRHAHLRPQPCGRQRRRSRRPGAGRAGEQRHHLVDLEDEHAAARHPRRRPAQQRHPRQPRARERRRAAALRPGDYQPAVQPELRQGDAGPHRAVPLRLHPRGRQEGRPDVPAAHAGRAQARRDRRHRHAPRRAVPGRRRGRDPPPHHRGRPARHRDRPRPEPVLRHRHPRRRADPAGQGLQTARAAGQGAVHQRRPRLPRGPGPEPPAPPRRAEDHRHLPQLRRRTTASPGSSPSRSWPTTTSTATSAATPTTPRRPSPKTCGPTSTAACPWPRSTTPRTCWSGPV